MLEFIGEIVVGIIFECFEVILIDLILKPIFRLFNIPIVDKTFDFLAKVLFFAFLILIVCAIIYIIKINI